MNRRRVLAALAGGSLLAGCGGRRVGAPATDGGPDASGTTTGGSQTARETPSPTADDSATLAELGTPETICAAEVVEDFHIRAVGRPAFADDWAGFEVADRYRIGSRAGDPQPGTASTDPLADEAVVIGLTAAGGDTDVADGTDDTVRARAYPLPVVWWHEAVNDTFGGPVLPTFCSICNTGLVAERLVDGEPATFGVSGQLWQPPGEYTFAAVEGGRSFGVSTGDPDAAVRNSGNLVLFDDATGSFWSQVLGQAICGPQAGERFAIRPATVTRWGEWRAEYPQTDVLLPPPYSELL
jgi:hypothetical protein